MAVISGLIYNVCATSTLALLRSSTEISNKGLIIENEGHLTLAAITAAMSAGYLFITCYTAEKYMELREEEKQSHENDDTLEVY